MRSTLATLKRFVLRYGVTLVFVTLSAYVLLQLADPAEVTRGLASADPLPYLVAIGFFYVSFPVRAVRWRILLDGVDVQADTRSATLIIVVNWFLNTLLPAKAGDFHRGYLASNNYGSTTATALGTIAAERAIDLAVLAVGLAVTMVVVLSQFAAFEFRILLLAVGLISVIGVGILAVVVINPELFPSAVVSIVENFRDGLTAIRSGRDFLVVVLITLVIWVLNVVRMGLVARAVDFDIALPMLVLLALLVAFLSGLPYTPAGIGVVEVVTTSVLVAGTGVSEGVGLVFILLDRLISVGSLVVVGAAVHVYLKYLSDVSLLGDEPAEPTWHRE